MGEIAEVQEHELKLDNANKRGKVYDPVMVLAHIGRNRLPDGTFHINDKRGTITKWNKEFQNLVPDESSRVYELFEKDIVIATGHNAVQEWRRVCFRVGGPNGLGRVLYLEVVGANSVLCTDLDAVNLPAENSLL